MSSFHPTNITIEPPQPPDYLAGAVLQGLSRPIGGKQYWGVIRSVLLAGLSFGVLPILSWMNGFKRFAIAEQQQFLHLAQWVRQNSEHPMARQLESDARELRPRGFLSFLSVLILLGTIVRMVSLMLPHPIDLERVIDLTYGVGRERVLNHLPLIHRLPGILRCG